ncbi:MAG: undecaprenyl-diphosphate phosphatase [Clostridia bacterium]|nr:undecaprenyl-diphosphate phosphatase [Clostridia bacterium]
MIKYPYTFIWVFLFGGDIVLEYLKSAVLGIVEGITEWLPISSTGHMILVDEIFTMKTANGADFTNFFLVAIQLGAILAVVMLYFKKLWPFHLKSHTVEYFKGEELSGFKRFCNRYLYVDKMILWFKILVASIPAAFFGILFDDKIDSMLTGNSRAYIVATTLVLYGVLFIIVERMKKKETVFTTDQISYKLALFIGLIQCLALIPGTSRSGTTILGAMLLGLGRTAAAEFSFFLSIPAMAGGSAIKLLDYVSSGNSFTTEEILVLLVGMLMAFVVSVLAIKFLMSYIRRHDFKAFGYYRILLGAGILAYFLLR